MAIFINGSVYTLEDSIKKEAFCAREGKFIGVGSGEEMKALRLPEEEVIDLKGRTVLPGFNDGHMHFLNYAIFKDRIQLAPLTSISEIIEKTKEYIVHKKIEKGAWVLSRGWNDNLFEEKRSLTRFDLDCISTEHPIFFTRICGHIGVCNSKALEVLKITKDTPNPEGGIIDFFQNSALPLLNSIEFKKKIALQFPRKTALDFIGQPSGILKENALNFISVQIPPMKKEEIKAVLKLAFEDALKVGLTSIHTDDVSHAGSLEALLSAYKELEAENVLPLRFILQLYLPDKKDMDEAHSLGLYSGVGSNFLKIGPLKLYQDGSLGGRTALMKEPYCDTNSYGVGIYSQATLDALLSYAKQKKFQVAIHAIGDGAMDIILNSYEKLFHKEHRPVIIHCQFTNEEILDRFKKIGVIANVQPSFVMSDWPIVEKAVGKARAEKSYPWKNFLQKNIPMAFSSDAPIESFNPLLGIYAAVTRMDLKQTPKAGWYSGQRLSVLEAVQAFTTGSAYLNFEENQKGKIKKGMVADFVVLSANIFEISHEKIKDIEVLQTYVNGKLAYKHPYFTI